MQDHPTLAELLLAVEEFLDQEVVPALGGAPQFRARVAANVIRIVLRELALGPAQLAEESRGLRDLLGEAPGWEGEETLAAEVESATRELCARIRRGDADHDPLRSAVLRHVRRTVEQKLAVAKPEMLAKPKG